MGVEEVSLLSIWVASFKMITASMQKFPLTLQRDWSVFGIPRTRIWELSFPMGNDIIVCK